MKNRVLHLVFCILFFVSFGFSSSAQALTHLVVRVFTDEFGLLEPLTGAWVTVYTSTGTLVASASTDLEGKAEFESVAPRNGYFEVSFIGYVVERKYIDIYSANYASFDVVLEPDLLEDPNESPNLILL